ncbi:MAG: 2OG-Fe(II) oxygenase [Verrucomicrobiales bacterium]|nr:2OG-Fe(II) oxygenase [Verrucomicrobiales bacterium]
MLALLDHMALFGWGVMPECRSESDSLRLGQECLIVDRAGGLQRAGVGKGSGLEIRDGIRRDEVRWLREEGDSQVQQAYLAWLEILRLALNERFFLGLFTFEGHFARFPEGGFYKAHLDCHAGSSDRIITTILYLNEGWQPGDGGELKLWTTAGDYAGGFVLIEPRMGTLVCFLAGDHWHEVLPTVKSRMSLTGWFLRR